MLGLSVDCEVAVGVIGKIFSQSRVFLCVYFYHFDYKHASHYIRHSIPKQDSPGQNQIKWKAPKNPARVGPCGTLAYTSSP